MSKFNKQDISDEDTLKLSCRDRCKLLNSNPVYAARHFQYRVEVLFKETVVDGLLGKVIYHGIRIKFQVPGSPHNHCFL